MLLWILLIVTGFFFMYKKIKQKQTYWSERGVDFIKPTSIIGSSFLFQSKKPFVHILQDEYNKFPNKRYHGHYNFVEPALVVKDPELITQITVKHFDHFADHRTIVHYEVDKFWGKNLFTSTGQRWKDMRNTLSPSFTGSKMRLMFGLMDECAQQFINFYKKNSPDVVEIDVKDSFSRYTNDVIGTCAFGIQCNSLENPTNEFFLTGKEAVDFRSISRILRILTHMASPTLGKLLKIKIIPTSLERYFTGIIEETVKIRKEKNIQRPDMINLMMNAQKNNAKEEITVEDISAHAFLFFLAGFETVSTFLTFLVYELALQPEIQERLREEINSVEGKISYDSLLQLKYLDMVTLEALRKWPPAIFVERMTTKEFTIEPVEAHEKPVVIEKGTNCFIPIYSIMRDPKYFSDPDTFDPERFNDENKPTINHATYLPFGSGPRICIGNRFALMEGKLMIYHILKNFEVVPVEKTPIPVELVDTKTANLGMKGIMWLGLRPLKPQV